VIALHEGFDGDHHAEELFLVDLHAAADGVAVGRGVEAGGGDDLLFAHEDAGALGTADAFTAGEDDEGEAHFVEAGHVLEG